jgi:ATP-binding cassette subfamily F protein uup
VLSGGERARLSLARAFARPFNLLVLDEPTNDLDLETLDLLQERLAEYPGTVLLVSQDRDFLDRVVTSVIATEGNGRWIEYAGGYTDMLAQRGPVGRGTPPAKASITKRQADVAIPRLCRNPVSLPCSAVVDSFPASTLITVDLRFDE